MQRINLADEIGYAIGALRGLRAEMREEIAKRDARIVELEARLAALERGPAPKPRGR